jgi:hypothetical protein
MTKTNLHNIAAPGSVSPMYMYELVDNCTVEVCMSTVDLSDRRMDEINNKVDSSLNTALSFRVILVTWLIFTSER